MPDDETLDERELQQRLAAWEEQSLFDLEGSEEEDDDGDDEDDVKKHASAPRPDSLAPAPVAALKDPPKPDGNAQESELAALQHLLTARCRENEHPSNRAEAEGDGGDEDDQKAEATKPEEATAADAEESKADLPLKVCPVCFDELPPNQMHAMSCGHSACVDCWRGLIVAMLSETHEVAMTTTCPVQRCAAVVNKVLIQRIAPEMLPSFENHQRHSFVQGNFHTVRWCPGRDCKQAAIIPRNNPFEDNVADFCCGQCQTSFCLCCGNSPHDGVCQRDVLEMEAPAVAGGGDMEERQLHLTQDDKKRKQCPKCQVWTEKIGGCNRVVCTKCRHSCCWLCLGNCITCGSHFCGQQNGHRRAHRNAMAHQIVVDMDFLRNAIGDEPDNGATQWTMQTLQALERHAHCCNRCFAHNQGQKFAERMCPCLEARTVNCTIVAGVQSGADVDFVRSADETLVASRRLLKCAHCSVDRSKRIDEADGENSHLGFLHLECLERFAEELSGVSETASSRQDRTRVLDLISVVAKCMGSLSDFESLEPLKSE